MSAVIKMQVDTMSEGTTKCNEPLMASLLDIVMAINPIIKIGSLFALVEGRMASSMAAVCRGDVGATIMNHIGPVEVRYTHLGDKLVKIEAMGVDWRVRDLFGPDKDHLHLENNCSQAMARCLSAMWAEQYHDKDVFEMCMDLAQIRLENYVPSHDLCTLYWQAILTALRTVNWPKEEQTEISFYHVVNGKHIPIKLEHTNPGKEFAISCADISGPFRTVIPMHFLFPSVENVAGYIEPINTNHSF